MANDKLIEQLNKVLGEDGVQTQASRNEYYRKGFRSGSGSALAVVFPDSLTKLWQVLQACVEADVIIIMQAAKTGLTEGSTPSGDDYDREVVVINTLAMNDIVLLNEGEQALGFPGATLFSLENTLKPLKRAPHSVIGSSSLGASIVGGISNNSGGALVKRGPAYTEMALFAQITAEGKLELVNHLGIDLGETPEEIVANLESGNFQKEGLSDHGKQASDREYVDRIRDVDADTPARFNADKRRLFEASGCAGKLAVFAVRLDTFPIAKEDQTFYIGTNNPDVLSRLRRDMLQNFENMPDVGEYMHRDIFNISEKYGKDTVLTIHHLGTGALPKLFALKGRVDARLRKMSFLPTHVSDRIMQAASRLFPQQMPKRLLEYRDNYEHHLMLKMTDDGIAEAASYLKTFFESEENEGDFITCTKEEAAKAYLNRFAAAGAAMRYEAVHDKEVGEMLALDIALRRNDENWVEELPEAISSQIEHTLYYGHFMCHVFHQDYILKKGADAKAVKAAMLELLDTRGAKYPAEHNVGHLYKAESDLQDFYRKLDPTNTFNPGIGKMDKYKRNCGCCA
jgi:D-lactate dehydrogenase